MSTTEKLSMSHEDYLEAIYVLAHDGSDEVKSVDIASQLNVSKASVNKAVNYLREAGYVEQSPYGKITLTPEGISYGAAVLERHRMLKGFLMNQLGVSEEVAQDEACMMEHAISDDTLARWHAYLDRCKQCSNDLNDLLTLQPSD